MPIPPAYITGLVLKEGFRKTLNETELASERIIETLKDRVLNIMDQ